MEKETLTKLIDKMNSELNLAIGMITMHRNDSPELKKTHAKLLELAEDLDTLINEHLLDDLEV